jgi:uncharacterized protein
MDGKIASGGGPRDPVGSDLRLRVVTALDQVEPEAWDALDHGPSPFLEHGFLRALELSGSIGRGSGWHPFYLLVEAPGNEGGPRLVGAVAAFVKSHSYGEYIFDWSWAGASERAGIPYYPKLVVAAPVTPATGRRILLAPDLGPARDAVVDRLVDGVRELSDEAGCSSIHWLFCTADETGLLADRGFAPRASFQFHWHDHGYADFDDFLARMSSRKRKQFRKERRRVADAIDQLRFVPGDELGDRQLAAMDRYYRETVADHGGMDYLRPGFFEHLVALLPERVQFAEVRRGGHLVAGALYLETAAGLYGRYWGADEPIDCLHFEVAYYAAIERCIARGIPLFEAGAQGEHKLLRGFEPSATHSAHWFRHPALAEGIGQFLGQERRSVEARMRALAAHLPFKQDD